MKLIEKCSENLPSVCPEKWISDLVPSGWCLLLESVTFYYTWLLVFDFFFNLVLFWDLYDQSFGRVKLLEHI